MWSTPRPGCPTPGKETRYPLHRRLGGPQSRPGQVIIFEYFAKICQEKFKFHLNIKRITELHMKIYEHSR